MASRYETIPVKPDTLKLTTTDTFAYGRNSGSRGWGDEIQVPLAKVIEGMEDLQHAAEANNDKRLTRTLTALAAAEQGSFGKIPNTDGAASLISRYLAAKNPSGWLYKQMDNGGVQPFLVLNVELLTDRDGDQTVVMRLESTTALKDMRSGTASHKCVWQPKDLTNRTPEKVIFDAGYSIETPELREAYEEELAHFNSVLLEFSEQFRFNGAPTASDSWRTDRTARKARVINDMEPKKGQILDVEMESGVYEGAAMPVPVSLEVSVFDLHDSTTYSVRAKDLTPYVYNPTLADNLVLPESHRDLMDVLTSDIDAFTGDFTEDKVAGNVILCHGGPGLGKTLTAEVYSEIMERPLYALSTVTLGLNPKDVQEGLQKVFARARRWNAILLLDEADVFVTQRGTDLTRDAIVAEFLRVLEGFEGVLFMTTNRSDVIDEAILSRCVAVVRYQPPSVNDARVVWRKIAQINEVSLSDSLIEELVTQFPEAAPRDVKMLLRLVLRVAKAKNLDLTLDLFKRYATFRNM